MLYSYEYLENHAIEKVHNYIEKFFSDILLNNFIEFDDIPLDNELYELIQLSSGLKDRLNRVFCEFKKIDQSQKNKLQLALTQNVRIRELCCGDNNPVQYNELQNDFQKELKELFRYLYEDLLDNQSFKNKYYGLKKHFEEFCTKNKRYTCCPFCGLYRLNAYADITRDDYDHYLPKSKYPFNSINFKNLMPLCRECNRTYKNSNDPIFDKENKRRKAFYPFDNLTKGVSIFVAINGYGHDPIKDANWQIGLSCIPGMYEEINTWDDLYKISIRYRAFIIQKMDEWIGYIIRRYKKEAVNRNINFETFMKEYIEELNEEPFMDQFFLRKAVFECLMSDDITKDSLAEMMQVG